MILKFIFISVTILYRLCTSILLSDYHIKYEKVSIIINFYNETSRTIQETILSIVENTPENILEEIILINDFDNLTDLSDLTLLPKVKYFMNNERMGLMKSRNKGFKLSSGEYVAFLDSHVRVCAGWSAPLLNYLKRKILFPKSSAKLIFRDTSLRFAVPIIDSMNEREYNETSPDFIGTMYSNFTFKWSLINEDFRNNDLSVPRPMPIMPGGIFMTKRSTLSHLGLFDYRMEIWGAENIELSLRIWLCGGRIDLIPKSHVGHKFNSNHPYDFPNGKIQTVLRNIKRTALVWLTHNAENALMLSSLYAQIPELMLIKPGPLTDRQRIARRLSCENFTWYMENINPSLKSSFSRWPENLSYRHSARNDFNGLS